MISFDEALKIVGGSGFLKDMEKVDFMKSLDRVLAEDILSDMPMPPFNKSAVDGYACRKEDLAFEMEVIETIPAGKAPTKSIGVKQCSKIMTGAPVPKGADCVIMIEDVLIRGENRISYQINKVKNNICKIGEDIKEGEVVISKGSLIQPQHIAVLATVGATSPIVYKQAKVAVISTGDELVEPGIKPDISQIRNSNAWQLIAQIKKLGAIPEYIGIALDTEASTREKLEVAFKGNDIVLLTGGVSMGDFDYVPKVLNDLGVELKFKSIAVQPGRPTVFGVRKKQYIFGLPGNPVSSFVQFELLVKPMIYKLMGYSFQPAIIRIPLGKEYNRKRSDRLSWLPIKINAGGEIIPLEYHGSAHINALTLADGLISVPIGKTTLKKGDLVDVRQI